MEMRHSPGWVRREDTDLLKLHGLTWRVPNKWKLLTVSTSSLVLDQPGRVYECQVSLGPEASPITPAFGATEGSSSQNEAPVAADMSWVPTERQALP